MCTVCGCTPEAGAPEAGHHHHEGGGFHEHVLPDGTVQRHADHDHAHSHSHEHEHDGHPHEHAHEHSHEHGHDHSHEHGHDHDHDHHHDHDHEHEHEHGKVEHGTLRLDRGPAGTEVPGMSQRRLVEIETSILGKNDALAAKNRAYFSGLQVKSFNLISSPGSGKTTLLVETLRRMKGQPLAVIEGDQQTDLDAKRIRETGVQAIQVNTGKGCHLDAQMVRRAMDGMQIARGTTLFIENVGNLVCPAGFDLGEVARVALLSITEGEDKPLKYPDAFAGSELVLITKLDLQPLVQADLEQLRANILRVSPKAKILEVSARSGEGMAAWTQWLAGPHATVTAS